MEKKKNTQITEQQVAITTYLDALLGEIVMEPEVETVPETQVKLIEPEVVIQEPEVVQETHVIEPEVIEAPVVVQTEVITPAPPVTQHVSVPTITPEIVEKTHPDWADDEFDCLLFRVMGLGLAVPLVKLDSVINLDEKLTSLPNKQPWFMGLLNHRGANIKIIDTGRFVVPDNRRIDESFDPNEAYNKAILICGKWGLACDDLSDVIKLNTDDVRWRTQSGKRPWLAGTVKERLCALLDVDQFCKMLTNGN